MESISSLNCIDLEKLRYRSTLLFETAAWIPCSGECNHFPSNGYRLFLVSSEYNKVQVKASDSSLCNWVHT